MAIAEEAADVCSNLVAVERKPSAVQSTRAMILAAPTPLRAMARRRAAAVDPPVEEDLQALCARLRAECKASDEKRREVELRVAELECRLAAITPAGTGAVAPVQAAQEQLHPAADAKCQEPAASDQIDESPGLAKLRAEAKRAGKESASFWRALEAEVDSPVLRALRKQDAAARAAAEAKVERRTRNALWETLQAKVDRPTIIAVAQGIGSGHEKEPALPVHVARRLFEEQKMDQGTPEPASGGSDASTLASGRRPSRTASMPTLRDVTAIMQKDTRSRKHPDKERAQDQVGGTEASTPASSKVRNRVREFELSGTRK